MLRPIFAQLIVNSDPKARHRRFRPDAEGSASSNAVNYTFALGDDSGDPRLLHVFDNSEDFGRSPQLRPSTAINIRRRGPKPNSEDNADGIHRHNGVPTCDKFRGLLL